MSRRTVNALCELQMLGHLRYFENMAQDQARKHDRALQRGRPTDARRHWLRCERAIHFKYQTLKQMAPETRAAYEAGVQAYGSPNWSTS